MNYLLDTHAVLWYFTADARLSAAAKRIIDNHQVGKSLSIASVWEVALKTGVGKLNFSAGTAGFIDKIREHNFHLLPITTNHLLALEQLPFIHRDPFDRLLVATAITDKLTIITHDANIRLYPVKCLA
ncbi:twitching motility protein PilT [Planctomycetales bacterium]|nr:twitching motility protein PilT [Planctomycetales bacterium]GHT00296.1 twitching motility protein PilT [Planctomycetales bacterium]GHT03995.1 twitching motility protein PilT [Planctomycetales bacterium]